MFEVLYFFLWPLEGLEGSFGFVDLPFAVSLALKLIVVLLPRLKPPSPHPRTILYLYFWRGPNPEDRPEILSKSGNRLCGCPSCE